jgi:hypothetical protein
MVSVRFRACVGPDASTAQPVLPLGTLTRIVRLGRHTCIPTLFLGTFPDSTHILSPKAHPFAKEGAMLAGRLPTKNSARLPQKACKPKSVTDRLRWGEQNPRLVPNSSTSQPIRVASTGIEVIRNSISLVGLLLSANFAGAAGTLGGAYNDARLNWTVAEASGIRVDDPAGIFTVDLGPPDKGPGRVLRSEDGAAGFAFYVQPNIEHDTPTSF